MTFPRLRHTSLHIPLRWLLGLIVSLASMQLAVVLIVLYAGVVAWATLVERNHGAAAAHFGIYDTAWFAALNGLLAVNILGAVLIRFPWKRRQIGFLVTHAGILLLLAGCLLSQHGGIEAQLPIFEGHAAYRAYKDSSHFELQVTPTPDLSPAKSAPPAAESIRVPFVAGPFPWVDYAKLSWFPWHVARRSRGILFDEDGITLETLDYVQDPHPAVRVRLTVDGERQEFDLATPSEGFSDEGQQRAVEGKQRRVAIALRSDEVDLGFQLYLHKFQRRLDPGSSTVSHYSSRVDVLDRGRPPKKLFENVLITLNAPVDIADPQTHRAFRLFQASFRGPWTPGDPEFDRLMGDDHSRDEVYLSQLSVNDDPGRGLKYVGCLLIVAGIVMVYYMRAYFARNDNSTLPA